MKIKKMDCNICVAKNKGADQLCSYCTADQHLWFRICKLLVLGLLNNNNYYYLIERNAQPKATTGILVCTGNVKVLHANTVNTVLIMEGNNHQNSKSKKHLYTILFDSDRCLNHIHLC